MDSKTKTLPDTLVFTHLGRDYEVRAEVEGPDVHSRAYCGGELTQTKPRCLSLGDGAFQGVDLNSVKKMMYDTKDEITGPSN